MEWETKLLSQHLEMYEYYYFLLLRKVQRSNEHIRSYSFEMCLWISHIISVASQMISFFPLFCNLQSSVRIVFWHQILWLFSGMQQKKTHTQCNYMRNCSRRRNKGWNEKKKKNTFERAFSHNSSHVEYLCNFNATNVDDSHSLPSETCSFYNEHILLFYSWL